MSVCNTIVDEMVDKHKRFTSELQKIIAEKDSRISSLETKLTILEDELEQYHINSAREAIKDYFFCEEIDIENTEEPSEFMVLGNHIEVISAKSLEEDYMPDELDCHKEMGNTGFNFRWM